MTDTNQTEQTAMIVKPQVLPTTSQFAMMRELAEKLAYAQGFLPDHFFQGDSRTRPHRILAAIEYGRALGLEPMIALQNITMIQGRAGASALLIGALVRRAGYEIASEVDDDKATVIISRSGRETGRGEFSLEDAKRAGLLRAGGGWEKYRRDMLYARALTQAARRGAQDAILGMAYTQEELGIEVDENGAATGEIPTTEAAPESVAALQEAQSERQGVVPSSIPTATPATTSEPPAAEVNSGAASVGTVAAPPASGPRAKRGNVVRAPKAATMPKAEPEPAPEPVSAPDLIPSLDEAGEAAYLANLRLEAEKAAATLHLLNVQRKNRKASLQGQPVLVEPPDGPNPASRKALDGFLATAYLSREYGEFSAGKLEELDEPSLVRLVEALDDLIATVKGSK